MGHGTLTQDSANPSERPRDFAVILIREGLSKTGRFTMYRRRHAAIGTLRRFYAQRGFSVPTSTPPSHA